MEQTNTPQQPSRKKAILSLLVLLALTCVVVFIFSSHWVEISTALAQLSFWQVLLVLAIGLTYPLLEGIVCWLIIRCRLPGFTLRRGLDAAFVGIFGNVVGLGAGAVPMESYYLYHCGLPLGPGVGLMTLQYVFHKTTVLLYATVMLLLQHRWLAANTSGVMHYLPAAYCVVALVILAVQAVRKHDPSGLFVNRVAVGQAPEEPSEEQPGEVPVEEKKSLKDRFQTWLRT